MGHMGHAPACRSARAHGARLVGAWVAWVMLHRVMPWRRQGKGAPGHGARRWVIGVTGAVGIKSLAAYHYTLVSTHLH